MSKGDFPRPALDDLIQSDRPVCYGVLKPGIEDPHGIPLVRIVDIESSELRSDGLFRITPALDKEFGRSRIDAGDLLLSIQGTVGRVAIVPPEAAGANISRTIARLSFAAAGDAPFYKHWFLSNDGLRAIEGAIVGTTRSSLNIGVLRRVAVPSPDGPEKAKIAEVLDTIDTTIHQTEAIIEKLKQVKQGLLHDLLTRGIDANGELRPPQNQAPHLYKESPLGWIPREWDCEPVGSKLAVLGGKRLPAGHAYARQQTQYRYLRVTDFFEREYGIDDLENLEPRTFDALKRYEIEPGELYISIAGSLGHVGVHSVPLGAEVRVVLTENAARLVPLVQLCSQFAAAYFNSQMVQRQIEAEKGTGGGVPKLALFRIEQLLLAWPHQREQELIVECLAAVNQQIASEALCAGGLHQLKAGLMDDLLTGRVRVTPLLQGSGQSPSEGNT